MSIDWKKIAVAAGIAFLLSFLVGALSRVSFLILVLRALLFAVLAGGLLQAFIVFARKLLPELFDDSSQSEAADQGETGRNVDILLPEEGGIDTGFSAVSALNVRAPEDEFAGEFAEDVEETGTRPAMAVNSGENADDSFKTVKPPDVLDDVDVLPDLDGFADVFAHAPRGDSEEGETELGIDEDTTTPSFSPGSTKEGVGKSIDPEIVAAAMRTLIKRDLKG
jgi:hypothetical protein